MANTKQEIRDTIQDFFNLVMSGKVVLKSYVNFHPETFFMDQADVFSSRPKEGQESFAQWGCPNKKEDDPDADGTPERPFEFYVHCFKPRTKS
jgi:hypothetical protein